MKKAIDIKKLKNGKFKIMYTTPNNKTRCIANFKDKKEAVIFANNTVEKIKVYYK